MRTALWESENGRTVRLRDAPPFLLATLDGNVMSGRPETVTPPRSDGDYTVFVSNGPRTINITGPIVAYGNRAYSAQAALDDRRAELCEAFNPKHFGRLTYYSEAGGRSIRCRPAALPTFEKRTENAQAFDIDLQADVSGWESAEEKIAVLGDQTRLFRFPWHVSNTVFGYSITQARIHNPSTEDIYPVIEVCPTAELVTVRNKTTGRHISINRPIRQGQKLVINMRDCSATIHSPDGSSADVSYWLTMGSEFFALEPGQNVLTVENESPNETPVTSIRYRLPYMGV